jgi:biotin carboxyl carrier protein
MNPGAYKLWVSVNGEKFLVEIKDLNQRPVIAVVDGSQFEIDLAPEVPDHLETGLPEKIVHSIPAGTSCEVTSPMPGDIINIRVIPGQAVQTGDPLCVLDAMKMKNTIHAPQPGMIKEIYVQEGQSVEYGTLLFKLT